MVSQLEIDDRECDLNGVLLGRCFLNIGHLPFALPELRARHLPFALPAGLLTYTEVENVRGEALEGE